MPFFLTFLQLLFDHCTGQLQPTQAIGNNTIHCLLLSVVKHSTCGSKINCTDNSVELCSESTIYI